MNNNIKKLVEDFYKCFDKENKVKGGRQFEIFVKIFLNDIGFEDIEVTGRSGDGGIDLICYKRVIPGSNEIQEKYIVQAKKYSPTGQNINRHPISDLQSNEQENPNGRIFITTGYFTSDAIKKAAENSKPVVLINGADIVNYYLNHPEKDVMIDWTPRISENRIKSLIEQEEKEISVFNNCNDNIKDESIPKPISRNDIRARILPIPRQIYDEIQNFEEFEVECFGIKKKLKINKTRKYFGGITDYYKKAGFIGYSGEENKKSYWKFSDDKSFIIVELL